MESDFELDELPTPFLPLEVYSGLIPASARPDHKNLRDIPEAFMELPRQQSAREAVLAEMKRRFQEALATGQIRNADAESDFCDPMTGSYNILLGWNPFSDSTSTRPRPSSPEAALPSAPLCPPVPHRVLTKPTPVATVATVRSSTTPPRKKKKPSHQKRGAIARRLAVAGVGSQDDDATICAAVDATPRNHDGSIQWNLILPKIKHLGYDGEAIQNRYRRLLRRASCRQLPVDYCSLP